MQSQPILDAAYRPARYVQNASKPLRILHFIPSLSAAVGGPARAVMDLCDALAVRGHSLTVVTSDTSGISSWDRAQNSAVHVLEPLRFGAISRTRELQKIRELVDAHDVVHLHGMWEYANVQVGTLCCCARTPYIVSPHGMLDGWSMRQRGLKKKAYLRLFGSAWLEAAAGIHTTTQRERQEASLYFSKDRGRVIPLIVDLSGFGPAARTSSHGRRPLRVLYLSRIDPKKSIETLLLAGELLAARGRRVSFLIAGTGEKLYVNKIKELARSLHLDAQFVGMVTGRAKSRLYSSCDVFALPTQHENFGIVYLEALASGLPVVTTPSTGLSRELQDSGGAMIVERSPEEFATAIERLMLDPAERLRMSARGRAWVLRRFDSDAIADQFERFYGDVACDASARYQNDGIVGRTSTVTAV